MRAILVVRLGALGDIVHALPVAAALRVRYPEARIDWVVDERHQALLELVPVVDRTIALRSMTLSLPRRVASLRRALRAGRYDLALDVQGLLKSAAVARMSGANRVVGFARAHLREPMAGRLYTETHDPGGAAHVVEKNLALAAAVGAEGATIRFPLRVPASTALETVRVTTGDHPFAVVNPGAAWPNKRWPAARFGALATWLRDTHRLVSIVTWGPDDRAVAEAVVAAGGGAAVLAPPTAVGDLAAVLAEAALVVSGDTGPLHLASALGAPVVAVHGPTDPVRNGPWAPGDLAVSQFADCQCRYQRRCHAATRCLDAVTVDMVRATVTRRLEGVES